MPFNYIDFFTNVCYNAFTNQSEYMARTRKKRYQLLRNVVLGALIVMMLAMIVGAMAHAIMIFMLTGIISGTTIVVPVWGMATLYISIVVLVGLSHYLDRALKNQYLRQFNGKTTLPRRRFGL